MPLPSVRNFQPNALISFHHILIADISIMLHRVRGIDDESWYSHSSMTHTHTLATIFSRLQKHPDIVKTLFTVLKVETECCTVQCHFKRWLVTLNTLLVLGVSTMTRQDSLLANAMVVEKRRRLKKIILALAFESKIKCRDTSRKSPFHASSSRYFSKRIARKMTILWVNYRARSG